MMPNIERRKKMKEKIFKYKYYIIIILVLMIISIVIFNTTKHTSQESTVQLEALTETEPVEEKVEEPQKIKFDIKGEVITPGVYEIEAGKRVSDAIEKSGGLTENADTTLINLSKNITDEMVIIIYNKNEIEKLRQELTTTKTVIEYIEKECSCPDTINDACTTPAQTDKTDNKTLDPNQKININTATKEELMLLSGIGESKAEAIIKYREENGAFQDINDLTKVSGIGESVLEKIKNNITI